MGVRREQEQREKLQSARLEAMCIFVYFRSPPLCALLFFVVVAPATDAANATDTVYMMMMRTMRMMTINLWIINKNRCVVVHEDWLVWPYHIRCVIIENKTRQ